MRHLTVTAVFALTMGLAAAQYDSVLLYQQRGNRDEGLQTTGVSGDLQVELVSARIEGPRRSKPEPIPTTPRWGETVTVRFYLPDPATAYLTVREIRPQSAYYLLSFPARREPALAGKWTARATNEYAWPTSSVLARLPEVQLDDLGVVVRLEQHGATNLQHVVPAALFDREPIEVVETYRFSFRPLSKVKVAAVILRESTELQRRDSSSEDADSPFIIRWRPGNAAEGWYRLAWSAVSSTNHVDRLDQEIRFYHRPVLKGAIRFGSR